MHGLGQILPTSPAKSTWAASRINNDTLESIVHQATINQNLHYSSPIQPLEWGVGVGHVKMSCPPPPNITKKRMREAVSEPAAVAAGRSVLSRSVNGSSFQDDCARASATFCWANDTATRVNLDESSRSLKTITTAFDDDSASHGGSVCTHDDTCLRL